MKRENVEDLVQELEVGQTVTMDKEISDRELRTARTYLTRISSKMKREFRSQIDLSGLLVIKRVK